MPYGMHRIADFNHQAIVPVGENIVFNIAISGDLQLLHKPIFAEDLFDKVLMQSIPEKAINKPGLLFKKLGFKLATYQQKTVNAQV